MKKITIGVFGGICVLGSVQGQVVIEDGEIHNIFSTINDWVEVYDSIADGTATTVNVFTESNIVGDVTEDFSIGLFERSRMTMFGGTLGQDLWVSDLASANVLGGIIQDDVYVDLFGSVNFLGGTVRDDIEVHHGGSLSFLGGFVGEDFQLFDDANALINGGSISEDIEVFGGSLLISGGNLLGQNLDVGLRSSGDSLITIVGSNFAIDGVSFLGGSIISNSGLLSGILNDGSVFSLPFLIENGGSIVVTAIPEPGTYALCFGAFAFVLLMISRKSRS